MICLHLSLPQCSDFWSILHIYSLYAAQMQLACCYLGCDCRPWLCRIAVMLWNPATKKPIHLGYWPSSLAAGRMADKYALHTCCYAQPHAHVTSPVHLHHHTAWVQHDGCIVASTDNPIQTGSCRMMSELAVLLFHYAELTKLVKSPLSPPLTPCPLTPPNPPPSHCWCPFPLPQPETNPATTCAPHSSTTAMLLLCISGISVVLYTHTYILCRSDNNHLQLELELGNEAPCQHHWDNCMSLPGYV